MGQGLADLNSPEVCGPMVLGRYLPWGPLLLLQVSHRNKRWPPRAGAAAASAEPGAVGSVAAAVAVRE